MARLIDGEALKDRSQSLAYDDWNQGAGTTWANAYSGFADMVEEMPTAEPTFYGYRLEHLAFIAAVMDKENLSPEEVAMMLKDTGRTLRFVRDELIESIKKGLKVQIQRESK